MQTFEAVELPSVERDLAMIVLLPKKADGLADMEKELTADKLNAVLARTRGVGGVDVTLPKFKTTAEFDLGRTLQVLCMKRAFRPTRADFSGLGGRDGALFIGFLVHQAIREALD